MMYLIMALIGAAAGFFVVRYMDYKISLVVAIAAGVVGGLLGGLIGSLLSFAAVILFKLVMALAGAYLVIKIAQRYMKAE